MPATLSEVARRAGVSQATASRVLNGRRYVSAGARERVEAAARDLDFVPHFAARNLSMARTSTIALLVHHAQYPGLGEGTFGARIVLGASRALRSLGYDLLYSVADDGDVARLTSHPAARDGRSDGILLLGPTYPAEAVDALIASGRPVVLIDNRRHPPDGGVPVDAVLADNAAGMHELTRHLLEVHGHRRIAFLGGPPEWPSTAERLAGYQEALSRAGLARHAVHRPETTVRDGREAYRSLPGRSGSWDAVVGVNDAMAIGALREVRRSGSRGPAVAGFDDTTWASLADPPLTTVTVDAAAMGALAARRLVERIEGRISSQTPWLARVPTRVRIRRSCGCVRTERRATEGHPAANVIT